MGDQQLSTEKDSENALNTAKSKTREHARYLWEIVAEYTKIRDITSSPPKGPTPPARKQLYSSTLIQMLSVVPYLLILLFGVSFFGISTDYQLNSGALVYNLKDY